MWCHAHPALLALLMFPTEISSARAVLKFGNGEQSFYLDGECFKVIKLLLRHLYDQDYVKQNLPKDRYTKASVIKMATESTKLEHIHS